MDRFSLGTVRKRLFGISLEEVSFLRRGFLQTEPLLQKYLEQIGGVFIHGYHAALKETNFEDLSTELDEVDHNLVGFAYEGAAMALALLDQITFWNKRRLGSFLKGPGAPHAYMVHVGAGWALARLRRRVAGPLKRLDPLLGWLVVDGYGFHEGYFHWSKAVNGQKVPRHISGYARRVFDQGLGRSLWFVNGADVARIPLTIADFDQSRRADLWSGVGLACAYAGGVDRVAVEQLRETANGYQAQLAQGAAFAAKARQRAGNPVAHTALACEVLCGLSADAAAALTDSVLKNLPIDAPIPDYELWRQRVQARFSKEEVLKSREVEIIV